MKILLNREDFLTVPYDLCVGEVGLEFEGATESFSIPYSQIMNLAITYDSHKKLYFMIIDKKQMYDGRITETQNVETFVTELKDKLDGVLNIEVIRN